MGAYGWLRHPNPGTAPIGKVCLRQHGATSSPDICLAQTTPATPLHGSQELMSTEPRFGLWQAESMTHWTHGFATTVLGCA